MINKKITLASAIKWLTIVGGYPETLKYCRHAQHLLTVDPFEERYPEPKTNEEYFANEAVLAAERREQCVSFAYGNLRMEGIEVTKERLREEYDKLHKGER